MVVAVEEGQDELVRKMKQEGITVVPLYGYPGAIDAVVYQQAEMAEISLQMQNFIGTERGILMVCSQHRRDEEVIEILKRRSYGKIF